MSAKDGDQGNPYPIHYSLLDGTNTASSGLLFSVFIHHIYCIYVPLLGSDGVFEINSTSGCLTLTTYPSLLKNELYEIKVKVKSNNTYIHI